MNSKTLLLLGAVALGGYLLYRYSQNSGVSGVATTSGAQLGALTTPGSGIINQAAQQAGSYVTGLIDNAGSSFGDSSQDS